MMPLPNARARSHAILTPSHAHEPLLLAYPHRAETLADVAAMRLADGAYKHAPSELSNMARQSSLRVFSSPADSLQLAPWVPDGYRVLNGRPATARLPVPLCLLVPGFGEFVDAVKRPLDDACAALFESTAELMAAMASDYKLETDRNAALLLGLNRIFPYTIAKLELAGGATTDGTILAGGAMVFNLELKHSGDPEMQNDCYLLRHTLRKSDGRMHAHVAKASPLAPAFLVDVHRGSLMVVRGAALVSPCLVSEELAVVSLVGAPGSDAHVALTQVLAALRAGVSVLARNAASVDHSSASFCPPTLYTHPACALPRLVVPLLSGAGAGGESITVTCTGPADGLDGTAAGAGHLVYDATVSPPRDDGRWLLKLARGAYGSAAHAAAAYAGHAPKLLGVASLPGGWTAVVMEALAAADRWRGYDAGAEEERAAAAAAYVAALASHGNVHGDLRAPNVLVRGGQGAAEPVEVMFLDWDWAGAVGAATYPLGLNPAIRWPEGAGPGKAITQQHDEVMLAGGAGAHEPY